jgi:hypothetical protein
VSKNRDVYKASLSSIAFPTALAKLSYFLSPREKQHYANACAVFSYLISHTEGYNPSDEHIASMLGLTITATRNALNLLISRNIITKTNKQIVTIAQEYCFNDAARWNFNTEPPAPPPVPNYSEPEFLKRYNKPDEIQRILGVTIKRYVENDLSKFNTIRQYVYNQFNQDDYTKLTYEQAIQLIQHIDILRRYE